MNPIFKKLFIYFLILVAIFTLVAYKAGWFGSEAKEPAASEKTDAVIPVSAFIVSPGGLTDHIVATGSVMANEEVLLSAEVSGRITSINFVEGTTVTKGSVLVTINDSELVAQLEKNAYNQKLAEEREQRQRSLLQKEAVSQEEYDRVLTDLNTVKAEASLIRAQLQKTRVVAPFTGTIGLRQVSEGAFVTPGQRIATLTQMQPVKIQFSIPERFAGSVTKNSKVTFSLEGDSTRYIANVYAIEPSIDPATRSASIRAMYPNRNLELRPGNFARIEFELSHMENALQIPAQAIIPELGGYKVYKYKSGIAQQMPIGVGIRTSEMVQITQGLINGDTIITSGILQLRSGLPVRITKLTK